MAYSSKASNANKINRKIHYLTILQNEYPGIRIPNDWFTFHNFDAKCKVHLQDIRSIGGTSLLNTSPHMRGKIHSKEIKLSSFKSDSPSEEGSFEKDNKDDSFMTVMKEVPLYVCNLCNRIFNRSFTFQKHIKRTHRLHCYDCHQKFHDHREKIRHICLRLNSSTSTCTFINKEKETNIQKKRKFDLQEKIVTERREEEKLAELPPESSETLEFSDLDNCESEDEDDILPPKYCAKKGILQLFNVKENNAKDLPEKDANKMQKCLENTEIATKIDKPVVNQKVYHFNNAPAKSLSRKRKCTENESKSSEIVTTQISQNSNSMDNYNFNNVPTKSLSRNSKCTENECKSNEIVATQISQNSNSMHNYHFSNAAAKRSSPNKKCTENESKSSEIVTTQISQNSNSIHNALVEGTINCPSQYLMLGSNYAQQAIPQVLISKVGNKSVQMKVVNVVLVLEKSGENSAT